MAGSSTLNQAGQKKDVKLNGQVHGHLNNILSKIEILRAIKQVFRTSQYMRTVKSSVLT
jgi:hypothetical protein